MLKQWRNRRGAGGRVPPRDFWPGNFCLRIGKKEVRKKRKRGENWEEKKENCKREAWKLEIKPGKAIKRGEDLFFLFIYLIFFFFFFAFHFWKRRKFVLGLPNCEFSTGKKHFTPGEKNRKNDCLLRKICLLRPCVESILPQFIQRALSKISKLTEGRKHFANFWIFHPIFRRFTLNFANMSFQVLNVCNIVCENMKT